MIFTKSSTNDEQFIEIVRTSTTWKQVGEKLGHSSNSKAARYQARCTRLGIPYCHIQGVSTKVSDDDLLLALSSAPTISAALRQVGLPAAMTHYDRCQRLLLQFQKEVGCFWDIHELKRISVVVTSAAQLYEELGVTDRKMQRMLREFAFKNEITIPGHKFVMIHHTPELLKTIAESRSYQEVCRELGLPISCDKSVKKYIKANKIDVSHFTGQAHLKGRSHQYSRSKPLEEVLVENSQYSRGSLKQRLIKIGLLRNECDICLCAPTWQGQPLVLRLDHKNGVNNDNRIENLRLLCPNCDSQTEHFTGRNTQLARNRKAQNTAILVAEQPDGTAECLICSNLHSNPKYCSYECSRLAARKTKRPSKEQLIAGLQVKSFLALGRQYGVSDNAVRKWAKSYEIETKGLPRKLEKRPASVN